METGEQVWRAYSTGPDAEMLVDPEKTTALGKPIGADSSLASWEGDAWKNRRRHRPGAGTATTPSSTSIYYGSGNPSTWNPAQRPGDNKWSMTHLRPRSRMTGWRSGSTR